MSTATPRKSPFSIATPTDYDWLKGLIYGDMGSGKTHLVASAQEVPEMQEILFIDAEAGAKTLRKFYPLGLRDVIRINDFMQLARIYEYLRRHCQARDTQDIAKLKELESQIGLEREEPALYRTVVIDSLSEIQRLNMYQLLGVSIGTMKLDELPESPEYKQWHQTTEMIRLLVRSFRDLPMNVIMVSSERPGEEKRRKVSINFPNQLATELPGFFDMLGYLEARQTRDADGKALVERRLNLVSSDEFKAKHRFGEVLTEPFVESPTMQKIFDLNMAASYSKLLPLD